MLAVSTPSVYTTKVGGILLLDVASFIVISIESYSADLPHISYISSDIYTSRFWIIGLSI